MIYASTTLYRPCAAGLLIMIFAGLSSCNQTGPSIFSETRGVYLNTSKMTEASDTLIYSTTGISVINIFPADKGNAANDQIPNANAFLCRRIDQKKTSLTDTIILLDTTRRELNHIGDVSSYWLSLQHTTRFKQCKVNIPVKLEDKLKRYQYKYAGVTLVTDD
jgi:hypothetical protein